MFQTANKFMSFVNIGIDLGTTNSVLAFTNLKPNGDIVSKVLEISRPVDTLQSGRLSTWKKDTLPSCVYYMPEKNYQPLIGDFAKMQYSIRPHLVAKSIKSQMGQPETEGLSPDIPDKTPSQISARILKHMITDAEKSLKTKITDAVITVPANFDSAMCQATREAARIAGIEIFYKDGTEKPILLSEPNAVIYDLFNQIRNGEIPDTVLDLSESRKVIVFDLGGGTLDITMHEIKRRNNENDGALKITEIATNRYTRLGGDDFDEILAQKMFERYLKKCCPPEERSRIAKRKDEVMPILRRQAEFMKIEMSTSYSTSSESDEQEWWEDESNVFSPDCRIACTGYSYEDEFTREELEEILSVYMADELVFDDYKRIEQIDNTKNIIFPILDVLLKASEKTGTSDLKVDAVIVNGGMSQFYMVTERLTRFFGFEPVVALNPDLSVARGAAVYHYLITNANHSELTDDMVKTDDKPDNKVKPVEKAGVKPDFDIIKPTLNDALYLCTRNNTRDILIPTGAELPFSSEVKKYLLPPVKDSRTSQIVFPIQSRNNDGTFRIIAKSEVSFKSGYPAGTEVNVQVHMNLSKVITMEAWIYTDENRTKRDLIQAVINVTNDATPEQRKNKKSKLLVAPNGSKVNPREIIDSLIKNCENYERQKVQAKGKIISEKIRMDVSSLCTASNRKDFAPVVISTLKNCTSSEAKKRLFIIARRIMPVWTEKERADIAGICMNHLYSVMNGYDFKQKGKTNSNIQAIYTLTHCGTTEQVKQLEKIHNMSEYIQPCVYAHGHTKTCIDWLIEQFEHSVHMVYSEGSNSIQNTAYFLGYALYDADSADVTSNTMKKIIKQFIGVIGNVNLNINSVINCVFAIGWIANDKNQVKWNLSPELIQEVRKAVSDLDYMYGTRIQKAQDIAYKLIEGQNLSEEEEELLLARIQDCQD